MSLNITSTLTDGVRRVVNRNGLVIVAAYILFFIVWQLTSNSLLLSWVEPTDVAISTAGRPTVDAPIAVIAVGAILSLLTAQYISIVAIRTIVANQTQSIPGEYYRRNIGFVFLNMLVGTTVYLLLVALGTVLLIVPGIIAYVAFQFMNFYIAVEDESFVTALRESWALTRGHWLKLFGLLVVFCLTLGVGLGIVSLVVSIAVNTPLGSLIIGVVQMGGSVAALGVLAEAFDQLRSHEANRADLLEAP